MSTVKNQPSDFRWELNENGEVVITGLVDKENATEVVVPAEIDGRPVVAVGRAAFDNFPKTVSPYPEPIRSSLTSITLPNGIKTIGDKAFYACRSLTSIALPNSLQTIGDCAFAVCDSLTSIAFPDGLQTIGDKAFYACESLTSVAFPDGLQNIGDEAFGGCKSLTSVALPDGLQSIGETAFLGCFSLTKFTLLSSENTRYRVVDGVLFSGAGRTLLAYPVGNTRTEYVVPDGVEDIDDYAFAHCQSLTSVKFPDGLQDIYDAAFAGCTSLTSVKFPDGLRNIYDNAFAACASLTSVAFPSSVQKIGWLAFDRCASGLTFYGAAGSVAEKYAEKNGLRFEAR